MICDGIGPLWLSTLTRHELVISGDPSGMREVNLDKGTPTRAPVLQVVLNGFQTG